jgi:indolepyruvate ferredoxin oxidoreductase alpha subunit
MHKLLVNQPGKKMFLLGNEAIARGTIEAGLAFASTYPGTPSSEISLAFFQMSKESDLYFEYSTNEKVALEVAAAAANAGVRSMCVMKHVGMNVAADALMTLSYVGVRGGLVILTADDPYMFSSQNEQDNRYYGKLSGLPILEPSSAEEAREMMGYAFDLSEKLQEPVIFRTTTRLNHSTAQVTLGEIKTPVIKGDFPRDPFNYVTVPAVSRKLHIKLLQNLETAEILANESPYNFTHGTGHFGVICNGVSYNYVTDAVRELGLGNQAKILRIGFSHPLPGQLIQSFIKDCDKVLVVEEGEPFMEEAVRSFAQEAGYMRPIQGKGPDLFSRLFEFDPAMVRKVMATFFNTPYAPPAKIDLSDIPELPQRPPNLCAGCSHRAMFYAVNQATQGLATIKTTDIGCYTLGFLPPLSAGDFLICMGSSVSTGCGFSKTIDKPVISFIGDSTFFHSGMAGLVNAVFNNHDITLIILDNHITAMTGHQPHPGVDMKAMNFDGYNRVSIESVVRGIGVEHISIIKPYNVKKSIAAVKEAIDHKGVSVIIAQQGCTLFERSLQKQSGKPFYVSDKCKNHRNCINDLGCPAFFVENDKVRINPNQCSGCGVCAQICPEHAIMPLK